MVKRKAKIAQDEEDKASRGLLNMLMCASMSVTTITTGTNPARPALCVRLFFNHLPDH